MKIIIHDHAENIRRTEVQINHRDLHKEMVTKNYISIKQN